MRRYGRMVLISLGFFAMTGCQVLTGGNVFSPRLSDDTITTSVSQAMMNNQNLINVPIHVETHQGNVILSGYVKTIRQSDTAGEVASKVHGVKTVQNNLIVRKW
ncbi:BON domain-containing protein [Legionella hackeliae]|uniref:Periplasmic, osmotically inducible protein Y-like n=1 Tax=Legionella hackeliae TaxID=449 RepID=A0A0A8URT8_LEGHA|nr:BON domain-containing protein [Legionella hackeliae]KTD15182.1 phospholipid binding protein [Legionella hackeliae]CEK11453.1 Periplasmic, osmotically inducible protein Y-like [Legionella hackeliae]STX48225.1 periplasmic, osmotically inducible protein Y-like protein [Legionella hackeliae]